MKIMLIAVLLLVSPALFAAPFIVSDETLQTVTHCGFMVDSQTKIDVPVVTTATGKSCKADLNGIAIGAHTVKATFINIDPVWGRQESVASLPFTFTKPALNLTVPAGLAITP